jgi:hypothetical protein
MPCTMCVTMPRTMSVPRHVPFLRESCDYSVHRRCTMPWTTACTVVGPIHAEGFAHETHQTHEMESVPSRIRTVPEYDRELMGFRRAPNQVDVWSPEMSGLCTAALTICRTVRRPQPVPFHAPIRYHRFDHGVYRVPTSPVSRPCTTNLPRARPLLCPHCVPCPRQARVVHLYHAAYHLRATPVSLAWSRPLPCLVQPGARSHGYEARD